MIIYWFEAEVWNPATNVVVTLRGTSADIDAAVQLDDSEAEWLPVIRTGPTTALSVFDGAAVQATRSTVGKLELLANSAMIEAWAGYQWSNRPVRIYQAEVGLSDPAAPVFPASKTNLTLIFDGEAETFDADEAVITLNVRQPSGKVAYGAYAGTGGMEGPSTLKGTIKPWASGRHFNRAPVLVDFGLQLYQWHGYGSSEELTNVRERGIILDQTKVYHASAAALLAATVQPTEIHICLAVSAFRIGFTPVAEITCDFKGDNSGGFSARIGSVIKRLMTGPALWSLADIDTSTLDYLDAQLPHDVFCFDDSGSDIIDVLNQLLAPIGAYWDVDEATGEFYTGLFRRAASPDLEVGVEQGAQLLDIDHLPTRPPFWRNRVGYLFNPTVIEAAQFDVLTADPNTLTMDEKIRIVIPKEEARDGTNGRYSTLRGRAVALGLSVTALDAARSNWIAYRDSITTWSITTINSSITRSTWTGYDEAYDAQLNLIQTAISVEDAKRAVAGGGLVDTAGNPITSDNIRNNMALIDWWKAGAAIPWAGNGGAGDQMVTMPHPSWPTLKGPMGTIEDVMLVRADASGSGSGGWNNGPSAPLNPDKTYRFVVPILQPVDNTGAYAFWGCENVCDLNTTTAAVNPYFTYHDVLPKGRWHLFVGYIFPRNSTGKSHESAGIWDCQTGQKIAAPYALNFCFRPDGMQPVHRAYQYYGVPFVYQFIGKPLIECVDGSETDLRQYFAEGATLNNAIQIDANGNFINPVGTGSGTNVSNALVARPLVNIGSSPATIEGNSIRRPVGTGDYNVCVRGEPITGACFAELIIPSSGYAMLSLDDDGTTVGFADQKITVHAVAASAFQIYVDGSIVASGSAGPAGNVMRLVYDGSRYQLFINGAQVGADIPATAGRTHFPKFHNYSGPNIRISGLNYGPYAIASGEARFVVETISGAPLRLIGSNTVKRDGAGGWDSQCYTPEGLTGGCFASFKPEDATCYFMAGLNSDPTLDGSYFSLDYAFYMQGTTAIYIYESGVGLGAHGTWTPGTVLSVVYDDNYVRYLINGAEVRCVKAQSGKKLHFDSSVVQGGALTNLRFGPVTADASNVDFIHQSEIQGQQGNSVYKIAIASASWNALSYSRQSQQGTAFISGKLSTPETFIGLKKPTDSSTNYSAMHASFYRTPSTWAVWSYGSQLLALGTAYNGVTFTSDTEFRITYDGVKIRWFADGVLMYEMTGGVTTGATYQAAVSVNAPGCRVSNIMFGPYSDNAWESTDGLGKPESYSTRGPNKVFNGDASSGLQGWSKTYYQLGTFELSADGESIGGQKSFALRKAASGSGQAVAVSKAIPVIPGQKLFGRMSYYGSHTTTNGVYFRIAEYTSKPEPLYVEYLDMGGAVTGSVSGASFTDLINNGPCALGLTKMEAAYTVPAGVYWVSIMVLNWTLGPQSLIFDDVYLGEGELGADVTSYITGSAKITVECDNNGAPLTALMPKTSQYKLMRNGVDETASATWSITLLTGTITHSINVAGVYSISAFASLTAKVRITATLGGAVRWIDVDVEKRLALAETGGSGSGGTSATVPVSSTIAVDGMQTVSTELIFNTGSAGTATLTGNVFFSVPESGANRIIKSFWIWQRWNGSAWVDVDTEVESDPDCSLVKYYDSDLGDFVFEVSPGTLAVGKVVTGLTANSQVKFRLRARRVASSGETLNLYTTSNIGGTGS